MKPIGSHLHYLVGASLALSIGDTKRYCAERDSFKPCDDYENIWICGDDMSASVEQEQSHCTTTEEGRSPEYAT